MSSNKMYIVFATIMSYSKIHFLVSILRGCILSYLFLTRSLVSRVTGLLDCSLYAHVSIIWSNLYLTRSLVSKVIGWLFVFTYMNLSHIKFVTTGGGELFSSLNSFFHRLLLFREYKCKSSYTNQIKTSSTAIHDVSHRGYLKT